MANESCQENDVQECEDQGFTPPTVADAMKNLKELRAYFQSSGTASSEDMDFLTRLENKTLRDKLALKDKELHQKKISTFFSKS